MNVSEAIRSKRAVRQFTEQPLTDAEIERILNAGRLAQSSKNTQPWQFIVIRDRALLEQVATTGDFLTHVRGAAVCVVLAMPVDERPLWRMFDPEEMDFDMDMDLDLEDMEIEINRLGPELERLKPEMERLRPQMELLKKQLSSQLTAGLMQGRDELRKAMALAHDQARDQQRAAVEKARAEAAQALDAQRKALATAREQQSAAMQKARQEAQRALADQRKALEKLRQEMLRKAEMY